MAIRLKDRIKLGTGLDTSGAIVGLTNSNGIGGSNYNIDNVNQITINDPGEGIIWTNGSSGNITLAVADDSSDNILELSGTGRKFKIGEAVLGEHAVHTGYYGLWNTEASTTTTQQYLIISAGTDTYVNGDSVYIRAGNNSTSNELRVRTSGVTIGGNTILHAGNYTGYTDSKYLRSDTADSYSSTITATGDSWYLWGLGARGASAGQYGIGNRSSDSYRQLTFHVPNQAAYGSSGTIPSFGWYSNDATQLMKLESASGNLWMKGDLTVEGGDIVLNGTGRIQGIDTVSATTDAANKSYVDSQHANALGANARKIFNVGANSLQARRHTIGRLYYCGGHWGSDWQNIRIRLIEDSYSGAYVDYHIFGYYNGSDNQVLNVKVVDFRGLGSDTQRYKISLGTHTDSGWDHSGRNVYYSDLYVDVAYYKNVRVIVDTYGHGYLTSNPTSGGFHTVLYDSISAANISDFTDPKTTTYVGDGSIIWNSGNDGPNSGLNADLLDNQDGSYYLNTSSTAQTKSGNLTVNQLITSNNGNGTNIRVGDDVWLGDLNVANTFRIQGVQNANNGYITFGNSSNDALGRAGTGALTWAGNTLLHSGNYSSTLNNTYYTETELNNGQLDGRYYTESEIDSKLGGKLAYNGAFGLSKKVDITIYGDDDKYYPVVIDGGNVSMTRRIQIYRSYSEQAPSTWNSATHKGSLTLDYEMRVGGWGGYTNMYHVSYFGEQYSRQAARIDYINHTMQHAVWLRGGGSTGAVYHIESSANISVTVYDDTSASNYVNGSGWRTYDNSNDAYDVYADYISLGSTADSYTQSTIINHMLVKANSAVNEQSGGGDAPGLNATTLDGVDSSQFVRSDANDSLSGQYTFSKTNDHAIRVGTIRGTAVGSQSGEYIHMYERVHIGGPNGWGATNAAAPSYGLSTYGGANLAMSTGNVGVGTSSPQEKLHIVGGAGIFNVSDNWQQSSLKTHLFRGGDFATEISNSTNTLKIYPATATRAVGNYWGGIEFMHLDPENSSWGTSYTGAQMWIGGRIIDQPGQERSALVFATNNSTTAGTHPVERMTILPNGNIGIGTSDPYSLLQIGDPETTTPTELTIASRYDGGGPMINFRTDHPNNANRWNMARIVATDDGNYNGRIEFRTTNNSGYTGTQPTTKMVIKATGYVGIGTTSPGYKLHVNGEIHSTHLSVDNNIVGRVNGLADRGFGSDELTYYQDSGALGSQWSSGWASHIIANHGNGSSYYNQTIHLPFWGPPQYSRMENGTIRGRYDFCTSETSFTTTHTIQAGTLRATADVVAYYSSDERLKDNIIPIGNAIDKIKQIGGYEFDWNDNQKTFEGHDYGVIAQEVEKVLPELVKDREDGYKGVRYEKLTSVLIQGIKEQQETIENQQKQIDELKDLVNKLINK